jgi:hypothetical protein
MSEIHAIPSYEQGVPLRTWSEGEAEFVAYDAELLLKASGSIEVMKRLIAQEELTKDDLIALGRLNAHSFLRGYEPMVLLYDYPRLDPSIAPLLKRFSKHFK